MGFYFDLAKEHLQEIDFLYQEKVIPGIYWFLLCFAGFSLACMGLAAHSILRQLADVGSLWDQVLVWAIWFLFCPLWVIVALRLAIVRKYVRYSNQLLEAGFFILGVPFRLWRLPGSQISQVKLVNLKRSPNLAPVQHFEYAVQGQWLVEIYTYSGNRRTVDRHTERQALAQLYTDLCRIPDVAV